MKLFKKIKGHLKICVSNGLKYCERAMKTMKMAQEMGTSQLL